MPTRELQPAAPTIPRCQIRPDPAAPAGKSWACCRAAARVVSRLSPSLSKPRQTLPSSQPQPGNLQGLFGCDDAVHNPNQFALPQPPLTQMPT
eukprot:scaffold15716_cov119-Isochrysis_galbana.AAC.2